MVKNGNQYYISNSKKTSGTGLFTISDPTAETWTTFNPFNSDNRLQDIGTTYSTVTFNDVQAVGWYFMEPTGSTFNGYIEPNISSVQVTLDVTPEPATLTLLAMGGLFFARRRAA